MDKKDSKKEPIFSLESFEGYAYRFRVEVLYKGNLTNIELYTNIDDVKDIRISFMDKVYDKLDRPVTFISFNSKEDDDSETEFITEFLKNV